MTTVRASIISRRNFVRVCTGGAAGLALARYIGIARAQPAPLGLPTVGNIRVKSVSIGHQIGQNGIGPFMSGQCALLLGGGIHLKAEVELERVSGPKPLYFGTLAFVQFVNYSHKRTAAHPTAAFQNECAKSGRWTLDGRDPFGGQPVKGRENLNVVLLQDGPGVLTEPPPREHIWSDDHFQSYLYWSVTDDNKMPTPANPAKRHILARVDWHWQGDAIGSGSAACPSGWMLSPPPAQQIAEVTGVFIGKAAVAPIPPSRTGGPPAHASQATPNAWVPCP